MRKIKEYGITTFEFTKLKLLKTTALEVLSLLLRLIVVFVIFTFILFLSAGIVLLLKEWLGKLYYGFFIITIFYLFVGFVILNSLIIRQT